MGTCEATINKIIGATNQSKRCQLTKRSILRKSDEMRIETTFEVSVRRHRHQCKITVYIQDYGGVLVFFRVQILREILNSRPFPDFFKATPPRSLLWYATTQHNLYWQKNYIIPKEWRYWSCRFITSYYRCFFSYEHTGYFLCLSRCRHAHLVPINSCYSTIIQLLTKTKFKVFQNYVIKFKDFKALN